jgi:transcriptional regulator with XRE-family HTH domain
MRLNLKNARKKVGMTQKATAAAIGISYRMFQELEAGRREGRVRTWDALEAFFGVPQQQLRESVGTSLAQGERQP